MVSAYYVPTQEAADVVAYARSLQGLGYPVAPRYARPSIPTAVVMRAAQAAAALRAAQAGGGSLSMSGMGLGILPTVNVRYAKTAIPAALASREWRRFHARNLSGLGKIMHAAQIPVVAGVRRQAGFFMGPGGGPGQGPFRIPGYLQGLGQDSTDIDIVTGLPCDDPRANCGPLVGPAVTGQISTTSESPIQTSLIPPTFSPASPSSPAPIGPVNVAPSILQTLQPSVPAGVLPTNLLPSVQATSILPILAVGLGAVLLLGGRRGGRRRNPSRRARRNRRR